MASSGCWGPLLFVGSTALVLQRTWKCSGSSPAEAASGGNSTPGSRRLTSSTPASSLRHVAKVPTTTLQQISTATVDYLVNEFAFSSPTAGSVSHKKSRERLAREENCRHASLVDDTQVPLPYRDLKQHIMSYDLDPYEWSDDELCAFIVAMFYFYGIAQSFQIPEAQLCAFVRATREAYKPPQDVIFHNFKHVFNVTHLAFHLLMCGVDQKLTLFDAFALLVAALCHDMDHPGVSNSFMISSNSNLATLYSNDSVLERHHAHLMQRLLLACGAEWDILCGFDVGDRKQFIGLVTNAILGTDMTHHLRKVDFFQARTKLEVPFLDANKADDEERKVLLRAILHTVDIGAQSHATPLAERWGHIVGREFSVQYEKEVKLGLPPSLFMADLDDEHKLAILQSGFIANIVLPLWSAVAECFPKLQSRADQLHKNLQHYLDKGGLPSK